MNLFINKKRVSLNIILIIFGIIAGWLIFGDRANHTDYQTSETKNDSTAAAIWTCSMHPQIRQDKPGKCPICGMDLIPLNTGDEGNANFDKVQMSESAIKIADIQTTLVQSVSPFKEIRLSGKVKPDERKIGVITSHFAGRIEKLFVNYTGQVVKKGEKMATVYSPELVTAQKELFEAAKLKQTSPGFYIDARNKIKLWQLTEDQIDNIENRGEIQYYFDVVANLSGTVIKREVSLGDHVEEGMKLFEIVDLSEVWVMFDAYENDLPWIKEGNIIAFEVQAVPGKTFHGEVTFIEPVINPETRVAYIRSESENSEQLLKPEMFVRGVFKARIKTNNFALVVPKSAVLWTGKKAVVYVKDGKQQKPTFEYREITLGEDAGNFYIVKDGLAEGEEIVSNSVFKVDAAAQLSGKKSMMNPDAGNITGKLHNHEEMKMSNGNGVDETNFLREGKKISFKVYGNCEMCKDRIEKAAKSVKGVTSAVWNVDSKIIEVAVLDEKIKTDNRSAAIANAGHDTEFQSVPNGIYNELPACCQFERKK